MKMQFGVGLGMNLRVDEIADHSLVAEDSGFSHLTFIDQPNLTLDVHALMTIAALNTRRIQIGHGVADPYTFHPWVIANATATVDELSGGRAFIGIGAGGSWGKVMNATPTRDLRDSVQFIRKYMSGEEAEFKGSRMRSEWIRKPVPIYIACRGPRACRLAGELGDGAFFTDAHPIGVGWKIEQIKKGALKAGRDPSEIDIAIRTTIYVAESKEAARRELGSITATHNYVPRLAKDNPDVADLRRRIEQAEPGMLDEMQLVEDAFDPRQNERTDIPANRAILSARAETVFFHLQRPSHRPAI